MYEKIARLLFDYSINKKLADEKFVTKLIQIISSERKIEEFIKSVDIKTKKDKTTEKTHYYDLEEEELFINLYDTKKEIRSSFIYIKDHILLYNILTTIAIMHELDHALLKKEIKENKRTLDVQFYKIIYSNEEEIQLDSDLISIFNSINQAIEREKYMGKYIFIYTRYHDQIPHEKRANINSNIDLSIIINILFNTPLEAEKLEKIRLLLLKEFIRECKYGYKIRKDKITNSPSIDIIKKIKPEDISTIDIYNSNHQVLHHNAVNKYSLKERIMYGLPLSIEEYKALTKEENPFSIYTKKR